MAVCSTSQISQRALPDRDPDAPDDAPSGPLLSLARWILSVSTSVYRRPHFLVLLFVIVLLTSRWVLRAFRARQSQFRKLTALILDRLRELGCKFPAQELRETWMLVASYYVHRLLLERSCSNHNRSSIDQSFVVMRAFRTLQSQSRKLTVFILVRMRELGCKFPAQEICKTYMVAASNYVHRLRELSRSNHIDQSVVLHSLSSWNSQTSKEARKMITLRIVEKTLLCIEGILMIRNASKAIVQILSNDKVEGRKDQDTTMQQTSLIFILNEELRDTIFARLDLYEISRLQIVCKAFANLKQSSTLKSLRNTREGLYGPSVLFLERTTTVMTWQWISYNIVSQQWKRMPSFSSLPLPDEDLFKDYLIAGSNGLMCLDVGKGSYEALIVYQPLTREKKVLPPLIHRRRPVLIQIIYNDHKNTYKIIVAGSSTIGTEHLSRKTEVYDSCTGCWRESDDIPGLEFALNEYQTGVYVKNIDTLLCIGFLPRNKGRGILAYNVSKEIWIKDVYCQLPYNFNPSEAGLEIQITNAQLIGYKNRVFLFSEQEMGQEVTHSIHELLESEDCEIMSDDSNGFEKATFQWKRLLSESRNGTRGLLVYPEFECQVHGENQFCIFNTIERSGILYTIHTNRGMPITIKQKLPPCPKLKENSLTFHTLNSLNIVFELSFKISL